MSDEPSTREPREGWSNRAMGIWVVIIFALQLGVLVWLGGDALAVRANNKNEPLRLMPQIQLIPDNGSGAVFSDPTLFSRPNRRGFSGTAWRQFAGVEHQLINWDEAPRLLDNQPAALGAAFRAALPDHLAFVTDLPAKRQARSMAVEPPRLAVRRRLRAGTPGKLGQAAGGALGVRPGHAARRGAAANPCPDRREHGRLRSVGHGRGSLGQGRRIPGRRRPARAGVAPGHPVRAGQAHPVRSPRPAGSDLSGARRCSIGGR